MIEISASPWFLSACGGWHHAGGTSPDHPLCASLRETAIPGLGHGGDDDSVPYHQLTFCPVDSPEPTRSTPSPAIRSTTTRTATSGSSSEWSGSTRARPSRSRGVVEQRTWSQPPPPARRRVALAHPTFPMLPLGMSTSHGCYHSQKLAGEDEVDPAAPAPLALAVDEPRDAADQGGCAPARLSPVRRRVAPRAQNAR